MNKHVLCSHTRTQHKRVPNLQNPLTTHPHAHKHTSVAGGEVSTSTDAVAGTPESDPVVSAWRTTAASEREAARAREARIGRNFNLAFWGGSGEGGEEEEGARVRVSVCVIRVCVCTCGSAACVSACVSWCECGCGLAACEREGGYGCACECVCVCGYVQRICVVAMTICIVQASIVGALRMCGCLDEARTDPDGGSDMHTGQSVTSDENIVPLQSLLTDAFTPIASVHRLVRTSQRRMQRWQVRFVHRERVRGRSFRPQRRS